MEEKKIIPMKLSIVMAFLCLAVAFYAAWGIYDCGSFLAGVTYGIIGLCAFFGCVYCFRGCSKEASIWYKFFGVALVALGFAVNFTGFAYPKDILSGNILIASHILWFGAITALVLGMDLGKVKTYLLCAVILASSIVDIILSSVPEAKVGDPFVFVAQIVVVVIYCIMSVAKYVDKASRNTK